MPNIAEIENIALFDLDGTLGDYDKSMKESLDSLRLPGEPDYSLPLTDDSPAYLKERADQIRAVSSWWENLEKFQLGWDILKISRELGYREMILTQGPRRNPAAWLGKKKWIDKNLGPDTDMTITRDKSLVFGKLLVDDYPGYIESWLNWRKRGLVIMPANEQNKDYTHPQVIRYDGNNLNRVVNAMALIRHRKRGEEFDFSQI